MHRLHRVVAAGLTVVCAVQTTGCMHWHAVAAPVPTVTAHPNRRLQVVHRDGRTTEADSARTDGTAVIAFQRHQVDTIPVAEVREVKIRKIDVLATAAAAVVLVGAVYVSVLALETMICSDSKCESTP